MNIMTSRKSGAGIYVIIKNVITVLVLFASFLLYYCSIFTTVPIRYGDEHDWIARSYFFQLFTEGDFSNKEWNTILAYDQPMLGYFMYGAVLYPSFLKERTGTKDYHMYLIDRNFFTADDALYEKYRDTESSYMRWGPDTGHEDFRVSPSRLLLEYGEGFQKTIDLIFKARTINVLLMALNVLAVYAITRLISGYLSSLVVSVWYGLSTLPVGVGLLAQGDGLFLFLFNLALLAFLLYRKTSRISYGIAFGILSGLCMSTKINGVLLLIMFDVVVLSLMFRPHTFKQGIPYSGMGKILAINLTAFSVFIVLNPYLYASPVKNTLQMYRWRNEVSRSQTRKFRRAGLAYWERVPKIYENFFGPDNYYDYTSLLFMKENVMGESKETFRKRYSATALVLFVIGLAAFVKHAFAEKKPEYTAYAASFFLIQAIMAGYLRMNFDRYYTHLALYMLFFQVYGLHTLIALCTVFFRSKILTHS